LRKEPPSPLKQYYTVSSPYERRIAMLRSMKNKTMKREE
jgi:hypothetical protein